MRIILNNLFNKIEVTVFELDMWLTFLQVLRNRSYMDWVFGYQMPCMQAKIRISLALPLAVAMFYLFNASEWDANRSWFSLFLQKVSLLEVK